MTSVDMRYGNQKCVLEIVIRYDKNIQKLFFLQICCKSNTVKILERFNNNNNQRSKNSLLPVPGSNSCGFSTEERIFGGQETGIDEYPWVALIDYTSR